MGYVQTERDLIMDLNFELTNYSLIDVLPPPPPPPPPPKITGFNDIPMEVRRVRQKSCTNGKLCRESSKSLRELDLRKKARASDYRNANRFAFYF